MIAALTGTLVACGGGEPAAGSDDASGGTVSTPVSSASDALKMYVLDCGTIEISDLGVFSTSGDYDGISDTFTDTCYLIRHPVYRFNGYDDYKPIDRDWHGPGRS